jgi:hypothetical protein
MLAEPLGLDVCGELHQGLRQLSRGLALESLPVRRRNRHHHAAISALDFLGELIARDLDSLGIKVMAGFAYLIG